jgi:predicted nucleic acid-binding protein
VVGTGVGSALMRQALADFRARGYADADLGFVDAAVLAIVERLNEPKLVTLDRRHFGPLRPRHVDALRLLPE